MGEFALYGGNRVKIGTCENMYYLRADQRGKVTAQDGNVDPVKDIAELRFRFPFPDEDTFEPGSGKFHDKGYHRGLTIDGAVAPVGIEHSTVQFSAPQPGYLVSLPCPESGEPQPYKIHRNGFQGAVQLVGQKYRPGIGFVPIMRCAGCGSLYRMEGKDDIEALVVSIRSEADRCTMPQGRGSDYAKFLHTVADRILAGLEAE